MRPGHGVALSLLALAGCRSERPGTVEMAAVLQRIYREAAADPVPHFHLNRRRVELFRRDLERTAAWPADVRFFFATELLKAGEPDEAAGHIVALLQPCGAGGFTVSPQNKAVFDLLGTAYLRQGIARNCRDHAAAGCILPISRDGVYAWQQSSRQAIALYEQLLT